MNIIELFRKYEPYNEQEKKDKEIVLKAFESFSDILTRNNEIIHLTSSGFVINPARDKVLMIHHNIYNSWAWTGGHADGEENLLKVAIREAVEETSASSIKAVLEGIFSLDVLTVVGHMKRGKYVAPHLHISTAYLLECDESEQLAVKPDENSGVMWIPLNEIDRYCSEEHMRKVYGKIVDKIREL